MSRHSRMNHIEEEDFLLLCETCLLQTPRHLWLQLSPGELGHQIVGSWLDVWGYCDVNPVKQSLQALTAGKPAGCMQLSQ
jgi:hypothetical protein